MWAWSSTRAPLTCVVRTRLTVARKESMAAGAGIGALGLAGVAVVTVYARAGRMWYALGAVVVGMEVPAVVPVFAGRRRLVGLLGRVWVGREGEKNT